jgi:hypothetical protein
MRVKLRKEVKMPAEEKEANYEESSIGVIYLNSLKSSQALQLFEEMINDTKFVERINLKHIYPTLSSADELKKMTGHKDRDGKFSLFF